MKYEYPWLLLMLPAFLAAVGWGKVRGQSLAFIKAASTVALVLALSGPTMVLTRHLPAGVVVLIATSAIMTPDQVACSTRVTNRIRDDRETRWLRVMHSPLGGGDLAKALREAAAMVPDGYSPRIVLLSDGTAAHGDLARAILELEQMRVAVDTISLPPQPIALESVALSDQVYTGERFAVDIAVNASQEAIGQVEINVGSGTWQAQAVHLQPGRNLLRTQQRTFSTGAVLLAGKVSADGLGQVNFERLLQVRRASIVYVSRDPSGLTRGLLRTLRMQGAEILQTTSLKPDRLAGIQLMVLSNRDLVALTTAQKEPVAQYVRDGGGLLFLGGEEHPYKEDGRMNALDRALPAAPAPPQNSGDKCVVVLMDKSSSMEGEKIRMAQQSVLAIADTFSSQDTIGVLAFDHTLRWVVPIQKFQDRRAFLEQVSNLTADGGTEIPPALSAAYHAVLISKAKYRHLVLITDGISEEGDSVHLATEASRQGIAISTVGIGGAVNRSFLEAVAGASGGRSYFLASVEDLKRITVKDVRDYTGSNAVDRPFRPVVRQRRGILDGVDMLKAPSLTRYTRYTTKPGAENILGIGEAGRDPFYVRWQYGLGRVGLLTSDAIGEWAGSWKQPAGSNRLWSNLTRDLYSHTSTYEVVAMASPGHDEIAIKYSLGSKVLPVAALPKIQVLGPHGFRKSVSLQETTPFSYRAQVSMGDQSGVFRILPEPPSTEFPATALLVQPGRELTASREVLKEVAQQTGGSFSTDPRASPVWKPTPVERAIELWPTLVGLAIALNIVELALRRKRFGLHRVLRRRRPGPLSTVEH